MISLNELKELKQKGLVIVLPSDRKRSATGSSIHLVFKLISNEALSAKEISEKLGLSLSGVSNCLYRLEHKQKRIICFVSKGKSYLYLSKDKALELGLSEE